MEEEEDQQQQEIVINTTGGVQQQVDIVDEDIADINKDQPISEENVAGFYNQQQFVEVEDHGPNRGNGEGTFVPPTGQEIDEEEQRR